MLQKYRNHHNVSRFVREWSDRHDLVYFGRQADSEQTAHFSGMTFAPHHRDSHFSHGTIADYNVSLFIRSAEHSASKSEHCNTTWTVFALELKIDGLPHVIFENHKNDTIFRRNLALRFPALRKVGYDIALQNPTASNTYDVFARPDSTPILSTFIDSQLLQTMSQHFSQYSWEVHNDILYVYLNRKPRATLEIQRMCDEAFWLAETIEYRMTYNHPAMAVAV